MEDFSLEQINCLLTAYERMARALNEYQVTHWSELTHEQHFDLNAYQNSLLNRAHDLQTHTTRPTSADPAELGASIQEALENAMERLHRLSNLTVALNIGAIAVALASYVARTNLRGIQTAHRELEALLLLEEE